MKKGILALASGTFGLGMTEYVMMSILPDLARDLHTTIPEAGHLISLYALGVCAGAPLSAIFLRNWKLQHILLLLMAVFVAGNIMFAVSPGFTTGLAARFISGLPHGAFFGTGSIVASRLMPDRRNTAIALMTLGMTIANLVGIPFGSFIANTFNWRWIFYFNAAWGAITFVMLAMFVKNTGGLARSSVKGIFRFLKNPAPWILIGFTLLCQGGCFSMYSYVSPIMDKAGLMQKYIPVFMIFVGGAMCFGNYISGVFADRYSSQRTALWVASVMTVSLVATYFGISSYWAAGISVMVAAACLFALSSPMQLLLLEYSPGGELMGGAMVQIAFNLGNAIGAFAGGAAITATGEPESSAIVGTALSGLSALVMLWFIHSRYNHRPTVKPRSTQG